MSRAREQFRSVISRPTCTLAANIFDPLSARIAHMLEYEVCVLSGSVGKVANLAVPDGVLANMSDVVDHCRRITRIADVSLMVDAEDGFGNAVNAARTVREMEAAGVSAIEIEDNFVPKHIGTARSPDGVAATIEDLGEDQWDKVMNVNAKGVFLGTKSAIPEMRKAGGGSIINISSIAGLVGGRTTAYGASKGAVRLFTKATAIQYAGEGIRANSVHPGVIETPMTANMLSNAEQRESSIARHPMGRVGRPRGGGLRRALPGLR